MHLPARLRQWLGVLAETFRLLPAPLTVLGILAAVGFVQLDRNGLVPRWPKEGEWVYGAALCDVVPLFLPTGAHFRDDAVTLVVPGIDDTGLSDAMFHMIRQNAPGSPAVLIRILEVLTAVASCERNPVRCQSSRRHADLVLAAGEASFSTAADRTDLRERHARFERDDTFGS